MEIDVHELAGDAQRQTCFANPTYANQREQAAAIQEATRFNESRFAAHEACQWREQTWPPRLGLAQVVPSCAQAVAGSTGLTPSLPTQ